MNSLQEIIDITSKLSFRLETMASEESKFCYDICHRLEQMSWETFRTANELKQIKEWMQ